MSSTSLPAAAEPAAAGAGAPAPPVAAEVQRRGPVRAAAGAVAVVAVWAAVTLVGPPGMPFHTKGEPREALVVRAMLETGDWVLPRVNRETLPSKPPLFHWLAALTARLRGTADEWSMRLPSVALSLAGGLGVYAAGTALWGARAGLVAASILLTSFEWARAATNARVDMALTVGLELALLAWLAFLRTGRAGWLLPFYGGMAAATLAKGPVGVGLPAAVVLATAATQRSLQPVRAMRLVRGALLVALVAGSWYALAAYRGGGEFAEKQLLRENLFRLVDVDTGPGDYQGHRHSAAWLGVMLLLGLLPWTVWVPGLAARLRRARRALGRDDPVVFLLVWALVVFGLYAVAVSKRGVYLLGLYPAAALLLAWQLEEQLRAAPRGDDDRWLLRAAGLLAGLFAFVVAGVAALAALATAGVPVGAAIDAFVPPGRPPYGRAVGELLAGGGPLLWATLGAALCGALACRQAARAARWGGAHAGIAASAVALIVAANGVVMPFIAARESARAFVARAQRLVGDGESVALYRDPSYGVLYYWGRPLPVYRGGTTGRGPRYLVLTRRDWAQGGAALQRDYEPVIRPDDDALGEAHRLMLVRRVLRR